MNTRARNRTLVFIIVLLLLTNIAVLSYFLFCGKKPQKASKNKDHFIGILKDDVGFDDTQVAQFQVIRDQHWAQARQKMKEIGKVKNSLLALTRQEAPAMEAAQQLADSIGRLQTQVEINVFRHIRSTRKICKPDQLAAYDSLMSRMVNRPKASKAPKDK